MPSTSPSLGNSGMNQEVFDEAALAMAHQQAFATQEESFPKSPASHRCFRQQQPKKSISNVRDALLRFLTVVLPFSCAALGFAQTRAFSLGAWYWATPVILYRFADCLMVILDVGWQLCGSRKPGKHRISSSWIGSDLPLIDIIVTTCREDPEVIMDTVEASYHLDYPRNRFRVVVADDGNDPMLCSKIAALQKSKMDYNLFYHARKKTCVETNPKACNVNSTLQWMQQNGRPAGKAEWFAVFDCDMMPEPQFLRSLLGEAVRDPRTAMAVCPQNYYNIPTNDPLYQSMEIQNTLDEPIRSSFGGTWCAGSGFLARRVAIDSIGGLPTESVCEDILCGHLLNGQGWNVVLVDLPLQWGLMPDSIESHIAQRRRWLVGSVQNGKITKFCLGSKARGMSVPQRLAGGAYCFAPYVHCFLQPLSLLILPWIFVVSRADQPHKSLWWLYFWEFFYRAVLFGKIWVDSKWTSRHALMQKDYSNYWLWSMIAPSVVAQILPRTLGPYRRKPVPFVSSGSIQTSLSERSSRLRVPIRKRVGAILLQREYVVNTFMAINAIVSLSVLLWIDLGHKRAGGSASMVLMVLISHSLSPNLNWERHMAFFIPILYAIFPPDVLERRKMMEPDRKGAWRVKKEYRKPQIDRWAFMLELQVWFGLVWSAAAFLLVHLLD